MLNRKFAWFVIGYILAAAVVEASRIPRQELEPQHWIDSGLQELNEALSHQPVTTEARNVILFVGDGMGLSTVTAARIYKGQLQGRPGEEEKLSFETFPSVGLAKTYNVDHQVPDSAATATAFLCGVKARFGTVGLDARARRGDCQRSAGKNTTCLAQLFSSKGKSTGLVTTARVTHATPAPLYAWSADRQWECDEDQPASQHGCPDIGAQLVDGLPGTNLNVVFGGGRRKLLPRHESDPEYAKLRGERLDGRNLINEWLSHRHRHGRTAEYVWNSSQFHQLPDTVDDAIGLFEYDHMKFEGFRQGSAEEPGEPSLAEMTEKAIKILQKNQKGYFLLVEGARIDHAHHANGARVALEETLAMERAVSAAARLTSELDTLLVVTADHSHALNLGSFSTRGNDILGLGDYSDDKTRQPESDTDHLPYTTLNYANGPGYQAHHPRADLTHNKTGSRHYRQTSAVPLSEATHDGTDVPIYARGPWAHLLHSTHEQHYLYHAIAHASCTRQDPQPPHCVVPNARPHAYSYKTEREAEVYEHQHMTSSAASLMSSSEQLTSSAVTLWATTRSQLTMSLFSVCIALVTRLTSWPNTHCPSLCLLAALTLSTYFSH